MKRLVITQFRARDVGALDEVSFSTTGDVVISGQNGVGKTTIKNAIMWAINGSTIAGEKLSAGKPPCVEVELQEGKRVMRVQKTQVYTGRSVTTRCYLNGLPMTQKVLGGVFEEYIPAEIMTILLEMGSFFELRGEVQRRILTERFSKVTGEDIVLSDDRLSRLDTKGLTVEEYMAALKLEQRQLKQEQISLPKMIEELEKTLTDTEEVDVEGLKSEHGKLKAQIRVWQLKNIRARNEKGRVDEDIERLTKELNEASAEMMRLEAQLSELREKWKVSFKKCPLCGHNLDEKKSAETRTRIALEGQECQGQLKLVKERCLEIEEALQATYAQKSTVKAKIGVSSDEETAQYNEMVKRAEELEEKLLEGRLKQKEAQLNKKNKRRIEELKSREKEIGRKIISCDGQIALSVLYIQKEMELITESINSHFERVKFQMFETLKNGEIRNICEATLNGVKYSRLSKGEKLTAALDVMKTLQSEFGVMFPVLIDDAESYTSNSLIEVPNQKILFKVVEGQGLEISA